VWLVLVTIEMQCATCKVMFGNEDDETQYPLHRAADRGCVECVKLLIENKVDVNHKDPYDETPLHDAVRAGRLEVVRLLLDYKAQVDTVGNVTDPYQELGQTPLTHLCRHNIRRRPDNTLNTHENIAIAKLLIDRGAQLSRVGITRVDCSWLKTLCQSRTNCKTSVLTFLGIRSKSELTRNARDTHGIIAKTLWSTRFYEDWTVMPVKAITPATPVIPLTHNDVVRIF